MSLPPPDPSFGAGVDTTCTWHPGRPAGRGCTRCGRPACNQCLVPGSIGSLCPECVRESQATGSRTVRTRSPRTGRWTAGVQPTVTYVIVALNAAVFLGGLLLDTSVNGLGQMQRDYGLFGPAVADGEWWRLVTSGFLHAGLLHVAFNMLIVWQAGIMLEPAVGHLRFGTLYVTSLLCGSAGALLLSPNALTVGASGAAFGLMGAIAVGLWLRGINLMSTSIGPLIVVNLVLTFAIPGISIGGHLGGLLGGAVAGWALLAPRKNDSLPYDLLVPLGLIVSAVAFSLIIVR